MAASDQTEPDFDSVVAAILAGGGGAARDLFYMHGSKAPHIGWTPAASDLVNPMIQDFARTCLSIAGSTAPIRERDFDINAFRAHAAWLMVLDVEGPDLYRYSHYGEGIANVRGISMKGKLSADFKGHIGLFFTAVYAAIQKNPQWLQTIHMPPKEVFARSWERLIVPVVSDDNVVTRIVVLNVPDNELRAGLEIIPDPVMILDADQIVRYANRAARRMFDRQEHQSQNMTLFEYAGIDLELDQSPAELVRKHAVHDKICLAMRNSLLQDFLVTISGAEIWDTAFYVLTLRADMRTD